MLPILYRDFYGVPRLFLVKLTGRSFLFDCPFDETLDDYPDSYTVYLVPELSPWSLDRPWESLNELDARKVATVPVAQVHFDSTKRESIDSGVLKDLALGVAA